MVLRQFKLGPRHIDLDASVIKKGSEEITLTPQEVAILECLMAAKQHTCSHEDLYREVWGFRSKPQGRAVHYALRRLRIKLEDDPEKANHLKTVRGRGYRLDNIEPLNTKASTPVPTPATPAPAACAPLPRYPRPCFGREADIASLSQHLCREQLITITAPGGFGKSRLAIELGHHQAATGHRVIYCDLTHVHNESELGATLTQSLGLSRVPHEAVADFDATLAAHCELLILDNADRFIRQLGAILQTWLTRTTALHVLLTSRTATKIAAEWRHTLESLQPSDARALFHDRVRRAGGTATPSDALLAQFEGHPLLLELAAPKTAELGEQAMLKYLQNTGQVLHSIDPNRPKRHQNLTTLIQGEVTSLSTEAKRCIQRLSFLKGSFTLDLLEWMEGAKSYDLLSELLKSNLITAVPNASPVRWKVPPYVGVGLDPLSPAEQDETLGNIAAYYADWVPEPHKLFPNQHVNWRALAPERATVHSIWEWSQHQNDTMLSLRVGLALFCLYHWSGQFEAQCTLMTRLVERTPIYNEYYPALVVNYATSMESRESPEHLIDLLRPVLSQSLTTLERLRAIRIMSLLEHRIGRSKSALQNLEEGITLALEENAPNYALMLTNNAIWSSITAEGYTGAERRVKANIRMCEESSHADLRAQFQVGWSVVEVGLGHLQRARQRLELLLESDFQTPQIQLWTEFYYAMTLFECGSTKLTENELRRQYTSFNEMGLTHAEVNARCLTARFYLHTGQSDKAQALGKETLAYVKGPTRQRSLATALLTSAEIALTQGNNDEAARYLLRLEPLEHYVIEPPQALFVQLLRNRTAAGNRGDLPHGLNTLDEGIRSLDSPLYRARLAWQRYLLAQTTGDDDADTWNALSRSELQTLRGGCPFDLKAALIVE